MNNLLSDKKLKKSLVVLPLLAVLLGVLLFSFASIGRWLKSDNGPVKSSAIVVLAGNYERSLYAADLYKSLYAPAVYIVLAQREMDFWPI